VQCGDHSDEDTDVIAAGDRRYRDVASVDGPKTTKGSLGGMIMILFVIGIGLKESPA
jgi:hypothetical protein